MGGCFVGRELWVVGRVCLKVSLFEGKKKIYFSFLSARSKFPRTLNKGKLSAISYKHFSF